MARDRKLRIGDLAVALNEDRNRLRLNLAKDSPLQLGEGEGGWRRFDEYDLCLLSIVRKLIPYGVGLAEAHKTAVELIGERSEDSPTILTATRSYQVLVAFWRDGDTLRAEALPRTGTAKLPDSCIVLLDASRTMIEALTRLYLLTDYVSEDPVIRQRVVDHFKANLAPLCGVSIEELPE